MPASAPTDRPPTPYGRALALLSLTLMAALAMSGGDAPWPLRAGLTAALVVVALASAATGRSAPAAASRSLAALLALLAAFVLTGLLWQLAMAATVVSFLGLVRAVPALSPSPDWRARGELPPWGIALVAGVTPLALVGWVLAVRPDLSDLVDTYGLRAYPLALLIAGAAAFALFNALLEELVWRGILLDRLTVLFGGTAAVLLQGLSFGLQHWHGVPRGPMGALLAGTWGVMLGVLRLRARGLLAPFLAHVVADTVIAVIVLTLYR